MDGELYSELSDNAEISSHGATSDRSLCDTQTNRETAEDLESRIAILEQLYKDNSEEIEFLQTELHDLVHRPRPFVDRIRMWYKRGSSVKMDLMMGFGPSWTMNDIQLNKAIRVVRQLLPMEFRTKFIPMDIAEICWNKLENVLGSGIQEFHIHTYDGVLSLELIANHAGKVANLLIKATKYQLEHEKTENIDIRQTADRFTADCDNIPPLMNSPTGDSGFFGFTVVLSGLEQIFRPCTKDTIDLCNRRTIVAKVLKANIDSDKPVSARLSLCSVDCCELLVAAMDSSPELFRKKHEEANGGIVKLDVPKKINKDNSLFHLEFRM